MLEPIAPESNPPRWSDLFGIDPGFTNGACTVDYLNWAHGEPRKDFLHDDCWRELSGGVA